MAALAGLCLTASAVAQQQVELIYRVPAGTSAQVSEQQSIAIQGTASDQWGNRQPIQQSFGGAVQFQMQVLQSNNGVPQHLRISFAPNLFYTYGDGTGQPQQEPMVFAGKSFEVRKQNGGTDVQPRQGLDQESYQFISDLAEFSWRDGLPGRAVAVGETWTNNATTYAKASGMDPGATVQVQGRLTGVGQQNGRPTAELQLQLQINGAMEGVPLRGTQQGRAVVDQATGLPLLVELTGQLPMQVQSPEGSLQGTATWQIKRQVSQIQQQDPSTFGPPVAPQRGGGGFGPNPGGGFGPNPGGGGGGFGPASGGGGGMEDVEIAGEEADDWGPATDRQDPGPSAPARNAPPTQAAGPSINGQSPPPFAGTFANDTLSVTLIERIDENTPRTIQIQRGDVTTIGRLTGNRDITMSVGDDGNTQINVTFQGFFEFQGNRYEFSAAQPNASQLKFTTGSTTHDLSLQPPPQESAPNPFE
jgi:hypothetical protein